MATVLVTGVGGAGGIGAVESLTQRTDHEVVGVDMDPTAAGCFLADSGCGVPAASDDGWASAVADVVTEFDVDVVVPTVDEELAELPSLYEALPDDVPVVAPRLGVVDASLDKYATYRVLDEAGHPVPETWLASDVDDEVSLPFPLLVKPRRGRGSRGIQRVADREELDAAVDAADVAPDALLVQEFIDGVEYTTSIVATRDDRLLGVVPKEAMEKQGSTVLGATRRAPVVVDECRALFETLSPRGPMNAQQIVDDDTAYTIEINPRFSSTACLTVAAGVDEFDLLVRDSLGETVEPVDDYEHDLYIRRYQDHVFVPGATFERADEHGQ